MSCDPVVEDEAVVSDDDDDFQAKIEEAVDLSYATTPGAYRATGRRRASEDNNEAPADAPDPQQQEPDTEANGNDADQSCDRNSSTSSMILSLTSAGNAKDGFFCCNKRKSMAVAVATTLIVCFMLAVLVMVILRFLVSKDNTGEEGEESIVDVTISILLMSLPNTTRAAIMANTTINTNNNKKNNSGEEDLARRKCSVEAWDWLLSDTEALSEFSLQRNLQRFALASLFFCTNGPEEWETRLNWLDEDKEDNDECHWYPYMKNAQELCNENHEYTMLKLRQNGLHGSLPNDIGLLSTLSKIDLSGNLQLLGSIPTEIALLSNHLEAFDLTQTSITGTIPTEIGLLTRLHTFQIDEAALISGTIPTEMGLLTRLQDLTLSGTSISGTIPTQIGQLKELVWLRLLNTNLVGEIPRELSDINRGVYFPVTTYPAAGCSLLDHIDHKYYICPDYNAGADIP